MTDSAMTNSPLVSFGIDFGTTNTVLAKSSAPDAVETVPLGAGDFRKPIHPTVLAFEMGEERGRATVETESGAHAIHLASRYPDDFRYVQSFKSHVASKIFDGTNIFNRRYDFADLLASFLETSGIASEIKTTPGPKQIVVGRPVKFHGETPDEDLAIERYRAGFRKAGIDAFELAFEPVGGAYSYFRGRREPVTVLIADFGGGTSDFIVSRFSVSSSDVASEVLSHSGIGIAGDTFDFRIIQNALQDHFGASTTYITGGKSLLVPRSYYSAFSRWHQLTLLRAQKPLNALKEIRKTAAEPEKIDNLIHAITNNLGLVISRAVAGAKERLSEHDMADIDIDLGTSNLRTAISRKDFESWIAEDIRQIADTVDEAVNRSGLSVEDIDQVFLVGGTSFIPAIQSLFLDKFGAEKVSAGERFSSVAEGLALFGREA